MAVEKTEREIGTLISEISRSEIKLPEIQRGYVWKPTQVARLIESLYLLDGQQRLTALSRALGGDNTTEIVFNVETEAFQNQSAATAKDPRYSHARLVTATDEALEHGWATVQRGLKVLVPLLKNNLKISHSSLLPSMLVLLPLIVLLGERPDEPLPAQTADAIVYWFLVATIRSRYSRLRTPQIASQTSSRAFGVCGGPLQHFLFLATHERSAYVFLCGNGTWLTRLIQ